MIGEVVGNYRIVDKLSEGGMGEVYLAEHAMIGKSVAVKVLHKKLCDEREAIDRFFNEARAATSVQHPGIVEIYDFGHHASGQAYIVMELLRGETLADRLDARECLPLEQAISITRSVASAVGAAHVEGIVHRDLKPDNIFLVPDPDMPGGERVKVLDFGIAKLVGEGKGVSMKTRTGSMMGTPTYMSPEQCRGAGQVDWRTDIYALGVIAFEMLAGRAPFEGEGWGDIIAAHLTEDAPSVQAFAPTVPREVSRVIDAMLAKDREARPQTMDEVRKAFGKRFSTAPAVAAQPRASSELEAPRRTPEPTTLGGSAAQSVEMQAEPDPRRKPWLILGGAGAVAVAAVVAFVALRGSDPGQTAQQPVHTSAPESEEPPGPERAGAERQLSRREPEPEPEPEPVPEPARATIRFELTPPDAVATLDGEPIADNTLVAESSADPRDVVVTARGYVSKTVTVVADRDRSYQVALERKPRARPRAKPRAKPPVTRPAPPPPKPKPKKPRGPLEVDL